ncbi:hypothetical protein DFP72DRAFT_1169830 [Ephemerocybe angulata]|uniref:Uncharacterized protein n=1 Tax=Ephemerocybe angulata TaxID=980116 RepID=A0A8H6M4F9_9AGAR|nr:hypothetical protein DFP72DRAFT_1169830 [Tulosesus angulatus]
MNHVSAVDAYITKRIPSNMQQPNLQFSAPTLHFHVPRTPMHFTALRLLSIFASLAVLSKAYSDDVFEARDYIDELSTRADASISSLSTRELIAELSERLDRRKVGPGKPVRCVTGVTRPKGREGGVSRGHDVAHETLSCDCLTDEDLEWETMSELGYLRFGYRLYVAYSSSERFEKRIRRGYAAGWAELFGKSSSAGSIPPPMFDAEDRPLDFSCHPEGESIPGAVACPED